MCPCDELAICVEWLVVTLSSLKKNWGPSPADPCDPELKRKGDWKSMNGHHIFLWMCTCSGLYDFLPTLCRLIMSHTTFTGGRCVLLLYVITRETFWVKNGQRWLVMMNKNRAQAAVVVTGTSAPCASPLMLRAFDVAAVVCVFMLSLHMLKLRSICSPGRPSLSLRGWSIGSTCWFLPHWTGGLLGNTTLSLTSIYISDVEI